MQTDKFRREEELEEEYGNGREETKRRRIFVSYYSPLYISLFVVYKFFRLWMMGE